MQTSLATVLMAAMLSVSAHAIQGKPVHRPQQSGVKPSSEQLTRIVEKRKAFRSRIAARRTAALAKFEQSRAAFMSGEQAKLETANRQALEKIKRGK